MTRSTSLAEIARTAGVSQMTVSRAVNNRSGVSRAKREEILRIADEMNYVAGRAAQTFSGGKNKIIGLVATELHNPFVAELVSGAARAARTVGYELLVYSLSESDHRPPSCVLNLFQQSTDGVIALLPYEYKYLELLVAARLPVITVDHRGQHAHFPSIAADSYDGTCLAMRHLLKLGHRRIAFVTGDERLVSAIDRRRGYSDSLVLSGIEVTPSLVVKGDFTERGGREAAQQLIALEEKPTAILAANDLSALGVIAAVRAAGLQVPTDISVIGFDDIPSASQVQPGLTTVRLPTRQMGRTAVNTLLAVIAGLEAALPQVVLPTELVVRGTTCEVASESANNGWRYLEGREE